MSAQSKKKPIFLGVLGIILLAVLGTVLVTQTNFLAEKSVKLEDLEVKEEVAAKTEQVPGFTLTKETFDSEKYPFSVTYPQTENEAFNTAVKKQMHDVEQRYLDKVIEKRLTDSSATGELTTTVQPVKENDENGVIVIAKGAIKGEETDESFQEMHSFQVNDETGEPLSINEVFLEGEETLQTLAQTVEQAIRTNDENKELSEKPLFEEPKWNHFSNFALTDQTINFYFNQPVKGQTPIVSIKRSDLNDILQEDFKAYSVDPTKKMVALTFDDGPKPETTTKVLETLEKYDAKATFFMLGQQVKAHPELTKDIQSRGHEIGNHSWSHPVLPSLPDERIKEEVLNTNAIIKETLGEEPTVFRPPYGAVNDKVRAHLTHPVIMWDVDTLDWKHRNPAQLLDFVKKYTHDRSIVLMHDIHQSTADGLDQVMQFLQNEGYQFVTVSELQAVEEAEEA